ncbi:MAG: metallophosphoesterase [Acidobacteriota bacterium]
MRRLPLQLAVCTTAALLAAALLAAAPRPAAPRPAAQSIAAAPAPELTLPNARDSVKFAAIGDNGTGDTPQYDVGKQMAAWRTRFPYDFVIMLGDNLYGRQEPKDFVTKFELPYKPLLDAGVKFYAALGNHDKQSNRFYKLWNMNGERYYTYTKNNVRFFVLDTDYMDARQLQWVEQELRTADSDWKIFYFHHPLYSDGGRHGSEVDLRTVLEPLFLKYGVNVVYAGHDHIYERLVPQKGIHHFVSGSAGQLRKGDLKRSAMTAAGFDTDQSFMMNEIVGDDLYFQVISRAGRTVDSGVIHRQPNPAAPAAAK